MTRSKPFYAVIFPDSPHHGVVLSRHYTVETAESAVEREKRSFHYRRPDRQYSWLEREVVECNPSEWGEYRVRRNTWA